MRFLSERPVCVLDPHSLYPQYCAGRVYLANIFDSLMAQASGTRFLSLDLDLVLSLFPL